VVLSILAAIRARTCNPAAAADNRVEPTAERLALLMRQLVAQAHSEPTRSSWR
jgi:hypothetical protein